MVAWHKAYIESWAVEGITGLRGQLSLATRDTVKVTATFAIRITVKL